MDLLVGRDVAILLLLGLGYGAVLVALKLTRR
jgi:hypothetical protein